MSLPRAIFELVCNNRSVSVRIVRDRVPDKMLGFTVTVKNGNSQKWLMFDDLGHKFGEAPSYTAVAAYYEKLCQ